MEELITVYLEITPTPAPTPAPAISINFNYPGKIEDGRGTGPGEYTQENWGQGGKVKAAWLFCPDY